LGGSYPLDLAGSHSKVTYTPYFDGSKSPNSTLAKRYSLPKKWILCFYNVLEYCGKTSENESLNMREEFAIAKIIEHVKLPDNDGSI